MLTIRDLHVSYGAIHAIHGISLTVKDGEIVSLIGANGAGKTTILHTITGLKKASSGTTAGNGKVSCCIYSDGSNDWVCFRLFSSRWKYADCL